MTLRALFVGAALLGAVAGAGPIAAKSAVSDLDALLSPSGEPMRRIDIRGAALSPDTVRDRLTVVAFASADCSILCATRTMDLDGLARALPASLKDRVVFLVIGTEAADGAARLRAFADGLLGPSPRLRFLPSDAAQAKAVTERLNYPAAALPEPPPTILLFDRRGAVAMTYGGAPLDAPRLQEDLVALDAFTEGLDPPAGPPDQPASGR